MELNKNTDNTSSNKVSSNGRQSLLSLVTLGLDNEDQDKMKIRQVHYAPGLTEQEKDISYLENLQSICYPDGFQITQVTLKPIPQKSNLSPSYRRSSSHEVDEWQMVKDFRFTHYSITTNMGIKRYLSIMCCREPIQSSGTLLIKLILLPFAFVIVQDQPAFRLGRQWLKCIYDQTVLPHFYLIQMQNDLSLNKQLLFPIRLEFHISVAFNILNQSGMTSSAAKSIEDYRENGSPLTMDHESLENSVFCTPNFSYKLLWTKISPKNIIQLFTCLILERKLILISKDTQQNAILIESILDLLAPLNKSVFMNISYLKSEMIDYLDSPLPFIIGISETLWNRIFLNKWSEISDDTVAFYVDTSLLMTKLDLPPPPEPVTTILSQTLEDLFSRQSILSENELKILLKQAFFNSILLMINDFRNFYTISYEDHLFQKTPHSTPSSPLHPPQQTQKALNSNELKNNIQPRIAIDQVFMFNHYLESQDEDNQNFYSQFIETQVFNDFIERSFRVKEFPEDRELNYFTECLNVLQKGQSFQEVILFQHEQICETLQRLNEYTMVYQFGEILESYERFISLNDATYQQSPYIKSVNTKTGIFTFEESAICTSLEEELIKQLKIKNVINKPQMTKKRRPSKKSSNNLIKNGTTVGSQANTAAPSSRGADSGNIFQQSSRNENLNKAKQIKSNMDLIVSVQSSTSKIVLQSQTFLQQATQQKVQTPTQLQSDPKSKFFTQESDVSSANQHEYQAQKTSNSQLIPSQSNSIQPASSQQEESKSDSSFKNFFQMTLQKLQNKLKNNQDAADGSSGKKSNITPKNQKGDSSKDTQLSNQKKLYNFAREKISNLTLLGSERSSDQLTTSSPFQKQLNHQFLFQQQQNNNNTVIGPKSNMNQGRPKCFSETVSSQFRYQNQTSIQIPTNNKIHEGLQKIIDTPSPALNGQIGGGRPSIFSASNKSQVADSPKSTTYTAESTGSIQKQHQILSKNDPLIVGIHRSNVGPIGTETRQSMQVQQQQQQSQSQQLNSLQQTPSGQKYGTNHQPQPASYSLFNQGVVILKEVNKDNNNVKKRLVKKYNINLDNGEESKNGQSSQQQTSNSRSSFHMNVGQYSARTTLNESSPGQDSFGMSYGGLTSSGLQNQSMNYSASKPSKNSNQKQVITPQLCSGSKTISHRLKAISTNSYSQSLQGGQGQNLQNSSQTQSKQVAITQSSNNLVASSFNATAKNLKNTMRIKREEVAQKQALINTTPSTTVKKPALEKPQQKHDKIKTMSSNLVTSSVAFLPYQFGIGNNNTQPTAFSQTQNATEYQLMLIQQQNSGQKGEAEAIIEGVQTRMRSISYTQSQPEFQSSFKFKLKKDKKLSNQNIQEADPTIPILNSNLIIAPMSGTTNQNSNPSFLKSNTMFVQAQSTQKIHRNSDLSKNTNHNMKYQGGGVYQPVGHYQKSASPKKKNSVRAKKLSQFEIQQVKFNNEHEEQAFYLVNSSSAEIKPLGSFITTQINLEGGAKKGKCQNLVGAGSINGGGPQEPKSPGAKGNQARPNQGDDDIFSPGNKDSSNNSLSSYE